MKREIGGNLLKFLFFVFCGYGIVRISIWSFFQTQAFFMPFDTDGTKEISTALALAFQYGQNIALFMAGMGAAKRIAYKNKITTIQNKVHITILQDEIRKSQNASYLYYVLFGVFALVDAGTNLGQFMVETVPSAGSMFSGFGLTLFIILGGLLSIVVVFVEELFMDTANAVLHAFNDVLESLGKKRIASLDLFVDPDKIIATRLEELSGKRGGDGGNRPSQSTTQVSSQAGKSRRELAEARGREHFQNQSRQNNQLAQKVRPVEPNLKDRNKPVQEDFFSN
jgi:hypothetical protein